MSFLANMPSRNAMNFSLMLPGEAGARRPSPSQTKPAGAPAEYIALNDTRPPADQVIGMCQGNSVLGFNWHQQEQLHPPFEKQRGGPDRYRPLSGGGGSSGSSPWASPSEVPSVTASSTPVALGLSSDRGTAGSRRQGYGGGGVRTESGCSGSSDHDAVLPASACGSWYSSSSSSSSSRGAKSSPADEGASPHDDDEAGAGYGRRSAKRRLGVAASAAAAVDEGTDTIIAAVRRSRGADRAESGESGGLRRGGGGGGVVREVGNSNRAGSSGGVFRAAAGGEEREGASVSLGGRREGGRAADGGPVVSSYTRGRVGVRKARRTYGRC
ncbi:unnamed protein product [Ectocarpus sp. 12 AP-2014]